jgi:hypothetical protein
MSRNKYFSRFEHRMFYFLCPPVTYLLTFPRNKYISRLNGLLHYCIGTRDDETMVSMVSYDNNRSVDNHAGGDEDSSTAL